MAMIRLGLASRCTGALACASLLLLGCAGDDGTGTVSASGTTAGESTTDGTSTTMGTTASTTAPTTTDPSGTSTSASSSSSTTETTGTTTTGPTTTDPSTTGPTTTDPSTTDPTDSTTTGVVTDTDTDSDSDSSSGTTGMQCVPMGPEVCDNGIDDDCNGEIDEKLDYDICGNGIDDNCNGEVDEKLGAEICDNGVDDDCNGQVDDGIYCTDSDNDGIPDADDPFPNDANLPGKADGNTVYAHTSSRLFKMDVNAPYDITAIGNFSYNQSPGQMTDIALDRWGVLYGITFNDLFVCNPATAQCYYLGDIPQSANGLTFIPPGLLDPNDDTLVAIANSGAWYKVTLVGNQAQFSQLGQYGGGYTSAGDVFSIQGVGTYGATNKPGVNNGNVIVEANPMNGMVVKDIATTVSYTTIYGLAGWEGKIFAFNSNGAVVLINPMDGTYMQVKKTNDVWWGAGVYSVLPQ